MGRPTRTAVIIYFRMKNISFSIILVMLLSFTSCLDDNTSAEVRLVTPEEMESILELEDVQLVDVRTPEEYREKHIDNAQNIDFKSPTFDEDIEKLDKSKPVVLYCKAGGRSAKCAKKLKDAGFTKIYDLEGGISKWEYDQEKETQGTP